MVYAIIVYLRSRKQWLWRGKGVSRPACRCQARWGAPFFCEYGPLARAFFSHEQPARCAPPQALADSQRLSGYVVCPEGLRCSFLRFIVMFARLTRV